MADSIAASSGQPELDRSPLVDMRAGQLPIARLHAFGASYIAPTPESPTALSASLPIEPVVPSSSQTSLQATVANPSQPSAESRDAPPIVPERLREKIDAIDLSKLRALDRGLHRYATHVIEQVSTGMQPNADTLDMDKQFLPLLAEMENHRHPGLNLSTFSTRKKCLQAILDKQANVQRNKWAADMRIVYPPLGAPRHHVALDVRFVPGRPPSIIIYESSMSQTLVAQKKMLVDAISGARVSLVSNMIQSSEWDCVMFSLNAALKLHKTNEEFAARIHDGCQPEDLHMPTEFKKHIHSKTNAENLADANAIVTKDKTGNSAETLLQRVEAFRTQRFDKQYSTSIEGFRLQEIQRAGEYLAKKPSK